MKKVILTIGGTYYEVQFEIVTMHEIEHVKIHSIHSTSLNCISILGYTIEDIENKVITSLPKAIEV